MENKTIAIIAIITSSLVTILWALGLIFADINLFILSMIVLIISLYPAIRYFSNLSEFFNKRDDTVIEDERTEKIEEKATIPAFASMIAVSIYGGIAIITLRNIYPEYINLAYPFFTIGIVGLIAYTISKVYYNRKYSD